eukprot:scaffold86126_cov32-Tisochrysis_lutea.AAC.7
MLSLAAEQHASDHNTDAYPRAQNHWPLPKSCRARSLSLSDPLVLSFSSDQKPTLGLANFRRAPLPPLYPPRFPSCSSLVPTASNLSDSLVPCLFLLSPASQSSSPLLLSSPSPSLSSMPACSLTS